MEFDLWGSALRDVDLVALRKWPEVPGLSSLSVWLDLSGTGVTDAGVRSLTGLTRLERLRLNGTNVTNAGLIRLKALTWLDDLELRDTHVTAAGITNLKRALPRLQVRR